MSQFREIKDRYLWQVEIRYLMTDLMLRNPERVWRVGDFVAALDELGVDLGQEYGIRPSKRLSDLLRTEIVRGRIIRVGWGQYRLGTVPDTTRRRIRDRSQACRNHLSQIGHR